MGKSEALVLIIFSGVFLVKSEEKYPNKYDSIDYETILRSDRLLKNYANCLLDKGPCTQDGYDLRRVLPDALETNCSKCSDKQKQGTKKVIKFLMNQKPAIWSQLAAKYDPDGSFQEKLMNDWT